MKRLNSLFISSLASLFILTGCGTNTIDNSSVVLPQVQANNVITVKSDPALFDFVKIVQKEIFKAYDTNKDNYLTESEVKDEKVMAELDLDKNGKVTQKEASLSNASFFGDNDFIFRTSTNSIFEFFMDKNKDKKLDRKEFIDFYLRSNNSTPRAKYFKTLFTKNDVNKDDLLTFSEYEDAMYQLWKRDIKVEIREDGSMVITFKEYD